MSERKKPGKKPMYGVKLTGAEKAQRYRQRLKEQDKTTMTVAVSKKVVAILDMYGKEAGLTRAGALEEVVEHFLEEWAKDYELINNSIMEIEKIKDMKNGTFNGSNGQSTGTLEI